MTGRMTDPQTIVEGMTRAQRKVVSETDTVRLRSEVDQRTWAVLFREGIATNIIAGGYLFFDLTPLGLAVRTHLEKESKK